MQSLYDEKRRAMSPASVQLIHAVLTRALSQAQRWRLVNENVATLTTRPKRGAEEIRPLDASQARALLDAASGHRLEAVFILALTTGARIGELLGLRWSDLDAEAGVLRIERTRSAAKEGPRFTTPKGGRGAPPTSPRAPTTLCAATAPARTRNACRRARRGRTTV